MGRSPCCEKVGLKKGPWTPEEDQKLLAYIEEHGHGSWRALPAKAGLQRCGKSCRLRWTNYLRPDIKRGKFSLQEEQTIIQLHALLGNRWSAIATHLPKRTDNEIKNYWNTHLKKRLAKMGIDPVTHKPKSDALASADGQSKNTANLSHMAQWESARLEAEARLARESKLRAPPTTTATTSPLTVSVQKQPEMEALQHHQNKPASSPNETLAPGDLIEEWEGVLWQKSKSGPLRQGHINLQSPTSTLSFSDSTVQPCMSLADQHFRKLGCHQRDGGLKEEVEVQIFRKPMQLQNETKEHRAISGAQPSALSMDNSAVFDKEAPWLPVTSNIRNVSTSGDFGPGLFTDLLLNNSDEENSADRCARDSDNNGQSGSYMEEGQGDQDEEYASNNYWNNILELVNSSPSNSSPHIF